MFPWITRWIMGSLQRTTRSLYVSRILWKGSICRIRSFPSNSSPSRMHCYLIWQRVVPSFRLFLAAPCRPMRSSVESFALLSRREHHLPSRAALLLVAYSEGSPSSHLHFVLSVTTRLNQDDEQLHWTPSFLERETLQRYLAKSLKGVVICAAEELSY